MLPFFICIFNIVNEKNKCLKSSFNLLKTKTKHFLIEKGVDVLNQTLNIVDVLIINVLIVRSAYESSKYFTIGDFYTVESRTWCNLYDSDYLVQPKVIERIPTGEKFLLLNVKRKSVNCIILEILYKNQKGVVFLEGETAFKPWKFYKKL